MFMAMAMAVPMSPLLSHVPHVSQLASFSPLLITNGKEERKTMPSSVKTIAEIRGEETTDIIDTTMHVHTPKMYYATK